MTGVNSSRGVVSIITPVYNAERFLKSSVESALGQSYQDIELILVNDGSSDNSAAICREYAEADLRVRIITQQNQGPAAARNNGLCHATGDYILFLDADDQLPLQAVERLVSTSEQYTADLVICNFSKQSGTGDPVTQRVSLSPDNIPFADHIRILSPDEIVGFVRHFLKFPSNHLVSYCWARLYRRSLFDSHSIAAPEKMRLFEDFVLTLTYLSHSSRVVFLNEPLYRYIMHESHVSASMAIINSSSLLHDMTIFRERTSAYLRQFAPSMNSEEVNQEIGHTLLHYLIIFMVRSCHRLDRHTFGVIYREISAMAGSDIICDSLCHYRPHKGNSKVIPLLLRTRLILPLLMICHYKAIKRYGRPSSAE